jgi:hypothetical protein
MRGSLVYGEGNFIGFHSGLTSFLTSSGIDEQKGVHEGLRSESSGPDVLEDSGTGHVVGQFILRKFHYVYYYKLICNY